MGAPVPDLLQTSPYFTCVAAGDDSGIVYAIDEREPVAPVVTPPQGAAFGVIGLDRVCSWYSDLRGLEALQQAASAPVSRQALIDEHGATVVSDLVDRGWLQAPDDLCRDYLLTTAQIEVTAHCNWGCRFCPVSLDRKPSATMPLGLFEEIIRKLEPYDTIRYVTFHFYNEPTLDCHFTERIAILGQYGRELSLSTNASGLTAGKIQTLKTSGIVRQLIVNLPSLRQGEFEALTQSKSLTLSLRNVDAAIEAGLPVALVVNGQGTDRQRRVDALRSRFDPLGVSVNATLTSDRAGSVAGDYDQHVRIDGPLRGCSWPVNHAHFSVTGDMFICCNDYYQRETFGNIQSGSIHEIMTSPAAVLMRRRVFGVVDAPMDYVCRSCHDQLLDFPRRQFRPLARFPVQVKETRDIVHG